LTADIDRLQSPGIVRRHRVLDAQDLERITADCARPRQRCRGGQAPRPRDLRALPLDLGPEVLVANGIEADTTRPGEIFKKIKTAPRSGLHNGGVYSGDRRIALGTVSAPTWRSMSSCRGQSGLVAHLRRFAGNTPRYIAAWKPLLDRRMGIADIDVDRGPRHGWCRRGKVRRRGVLKHSSRSIKSTTGAGRCARHKTGDGTCCAGAPARADRRHPTPSAPYALRRRSRQVVLPPDRRRHAPG
jgi:uncharacterized membrane-anchored protein